MPAPQTAPAWCGETPVPGPAVADLASSDTRGAATSALAALSATAAGRGRAAPPVQVEQFVDNLAGVLPFRLTLHQRETLETAFFRAIDAIVAQRAR